MTIHKNIEVLTWQKGYNEVHLPRLIIFRTTWVSFNNLALGDSETATVELLDMANELVTLSLGRVITVIKVNTSHIWG